MSDPNVVITAVTPVNGGEIVATFVRGEARWTEVIVAYLTREHRKPSPYGGYTVRRTEVVAAILDPDTGTLEPAAETYGGSGDIVFLTDPADRQQIETIRAGAVAL